MEVVNIQGAVRSTKGKSDAKNIRKQGLVPAVIYGTEGNIHLTLSPKDMKPLIYTPKFKLAEVNVDGTDHKCIVKDVQFHPVSDEILHIDFMKLEEGRTLKVEVPVTFSGAAPGVKTGGKLVKKLRNVKIKTTPEALVESMDLDVSELELGHSIRVRDISQIEGVEIMNSPGVPVASVETPRALRSANAGLEEGEEGEEGAEGEEGTEGDKEGDSSE